MSKESFAVIGLSKFGFRVATGLFKNGVEVLAIDRDERLIQKIADGVTRAVQSDAMEEETLEHLGVFEVDTVVIGFRSSFDAAVLLTVMLRKRKPDIRIVAQVDTDEKAGALHQVGADATVFPEQDIADRLVKRLTTPDLVEQVELAPDMAVAEMSVPGDFIGKSLADLEIRTKYGVHVIGVVQPENEDRERKVTAAPSANTVLREGEALLLLGKIEYLERFSRRSQR